MGEQPYDRVVDLDRTNPAERRGSTVAHPAQPWTPAVHAFLRHLEAEGFEAAPRVVGSGFDDDGSEILSWIEGAVFAEEVWPDPERSLHDVGAMLRRLHEVSRGFVPPPDARWMPWSLRSRSEEAVISHGNIAPWHVVFDNGRPAGIIGWEYSGPVDPIDEVAVTAWYCAQLFDDDVAERIGLPPAAARAEWFRSFLDGYGLAHQARQDLVDRILRFVITDNGWYARLHGSTPAWQSRAALWTLEHRDLLTKAAVR
ncbi:phosphotransferase [Lentzea alba]|uniref:phosphotransferase n=1 Tax=Lentzea alba TaxID=2714351 RepID=UPI0039BFE62C